MVIAGQPGDGVAFNPFGLHRGRYHADKKRRTLMLSYRARSLPLYDWNALQRAIKYPWTVRLSLEALRLDAGHSSAYVDLETASSYTCHGDMHKIAIKCRELSTGEATVKGLESFFFVTMFDERHTFGWTCGDSNEVTQQAAYHLAMCDDIGQAAYDTRGVAAALLETLVLVHRKAPKYVLLHKLVSRWGVEPDCESGEIYLEKLARKRFTGDVERAATTLLSDFRRGNIGLTCLEPPEAASASAGTRE